VDGINPAAIYKYMPAGGYSNINDQQLTVFRRSRMMSETEPPPQYSITICNRINVCI